MARTPHTNRIRELRELAGLTQDQLADRMGTQSQQIGKHERGERRLTIQWMQRYAAALGIAPADLISVPAMDEIKNEIEPATIDGLPGVSAAIASRGLALFRVLISRITDAGITVGQVITIDRSDAAKNAAKAGDVVAIRYGGTDVMLLRQFIPPYMLVTNMRGNRNSVLRLDDRTVALDLVGVVIRE